MKDKVVKNLDKIYLKNICCHTMFVLKKDKKFRKLIPIKTETGLIWMDYPDLIMDKIDYYIEIIDGIYVINIYNLNKKKTKYYLYLKNNILTCSKKKENSKFFQIQKLKLNNLTNFIEFN